MCWKQFKCLIIKDHFEIYDNIVIRENRKRENGRVKNAVILHLQVDKKIDNCTLKATDKVKIIKV